MTRTRYIQDPKTNELIPADEYYARNAVAAAPMVMSDIAGYVSTVDGSWIGSRSTHRDHLKQHHLIEIGNERIMPSSPQVDRRDVRRDVENAVRRVLG